MAERELLFRARLDDAAAVQSLIELKTHSADVGEELKQARQRMRELARSGDTASDEFKQVSREVVELENEVRGARQETRRLEKQIDAVGKTGKQSFDDVGDAADRAGRKGDSAFGGVTDRVKDLAGPAALGGAITGIIALGNAAAENAIEIGAMAENSGLAVETVAALAREAEILGQDADRVSEAMFTLHERVIEASEGNQTYIDDIKRLGTSWQELINASPDERLRIVVEAMVNAENKTDSLAAASILLGDDAKALNAIFVEQGQTVEDLTGKHKNLTDAQDVAAARKYKREMTELKAEMNEIGQDSIPAMVSGAGLLATGMEHLNRVLGITSGFITTVHGWLGLTDDEAQELDETLRGLGGVLLSDVQPGLDATTAAGGQSAGMFDYLGTHAGIARDKIVRAYEDIEIAADKSGETQAEWLERLTQLHYDNAEAIALSAEQAVIAEQLRLDPGLASSDAGFQAVINRSQIISAGVRRRREAERNARTSRELTPEERAEKEQRDTERAAENERREQLAEIEHQLALNNITLGDAYDQITAVFNDNIEQLDRAEQRRLEIRLHRIGQQIDRAEEDARKVREGVDENTKVLHDDLQEIARLLGCDEPAGGGGGGGGVLADRNALLRRRGVPLSDRARAAYLRRKAMQGGLSDDEASELESLDVNANLHREQGPISGDVVVDGLSIGAPPPLRPGIDPFINPDGTMRLLEQIRDKLPDADSPTNIVAPAGGLTPSDRTSNI